jgi:hypothetical protein
MRLCFGLIVVAACGDAAIEMTLKLPDDNDRWDTSCVQTIEVYTAGLNYPDVSNDYIGQTLDISDDRAATYSDIRSAVSGRFDVAIPDSGLSAVEMYGWNGLSGFFPNGTFPDLAFYARVPYTGQDVVTIELVPNQDCKLSNITVRPIDLITLVSTKSCAMAATTDEQLGFASIGTLTPGLYQPYLFGWGGTHGANVTGGVAAFQASTMVGPESCLAVYASTLTGTTSQCISQTKACAQGNEIEAVLIDDALWTSLDPTIQEEFRGGIIGAVIDPTKTPIAGATVEIPQGMGQVVYVRLDTLSKRLIPTGGTATDATGMFIVYSNDLVPAIVTATVGGTRTAKTVTVGGQRTLNDGTKLPAGVVVAF